MNPERVLGTDPAPGSLDALDRLRRVLGSCVLALGESRRRVEQLAAPDSIWQGPAVEPLVATLSELANRLRHLEDAVIDLARALETWRSGVAQRQGRVAELTEAMSQLAGETDADERRAAVRAQAAQVAAEHTADAASLLTAADTLAEALARHPDDPDLATDLDRALCGLDAAVTEWINDASAELVITAQGLVDTAGLTLAASQLIGLVDGAPGDRAAIAQVANAATGSHRLQRALRRSWSSLAPGRLPTATFGGRGALGEALADRLRGGSGHGEPDR